MSPTVIVCCVSRVDVCFLPLAMLQVSHSMFASVATWAASRVVLSRMRSRSVAVFALLRLKRRSSECPG